MCKASAWTGYPQTIATWSRSVSRSRCRCPVTRLELVTEVEAQVPVAPVLAPGRCSSLAMTAPIGPTMTA